MNDFCFFADESQAGQVIFLFVLVLFGQLDSIRSLLLFVFI